jgi:hypothetical protein
LQEGHDIDAQAAFFVGRQKGIAQVLQYGDWPIEQVQFFFDGTANIRRLANPIDDGRRKQYDHAVEDADHHQPQDYRGDQRRDPIASARADSGPSIIVTTKADATGSRTGRAKLKATTSKMTNMPIVADCAAVRQRRDTSATGWGSLIAKSERARRSAVLAPGFP